jgi:hypothetical protein
MYTESTPYRPKGIVKQGTRVAQPPPILMA